MTGYQIDLDPVHSVIRLTITAEVMGFELAEDIYTRLRRLSFSGGPYAAIYDLSMVEETTIPVNVVTGYARRTPSVPMGRPHVVVGQEPGIFTLARIFQMCSEAIGSKHQVVHTLQEAYEIVGARAEDFTERL